MSAEEALSIALSVGTAEEIGRSAERLAGPEVLTAERWVEQALSADLAEPRHLLLCDAAAPLRAPAGRAWTGRQIGPGRAPAPRRAGGLLLNMMDIDAAHEEEFNDWYDTEHLPRIAAVDGVIAARRFRSSDDSPRYLATYHLRTLDIVSGEAWKSAASTPWTARMRRHRTGLIRIGFTPL